MHSRDTLYVNRLGRGAVGRQQRRSNQGDNYENRIERSSTSCSRKRERRSAAGFSALLGRIFADVGPRDRSSTEAGPYNCNRSTRLGRVRGTTDWLWFGEPRRRCSRRHRRLESFALYPRRTFDGRQSRATTGFETTERTPGCDLGCAVASSTDGGAARAA